MYLSNHIVCNIFVKSFILLFICIFLKHILTFEMCALYFDEIQTLGCIEEIFQISLVFRLEGGKGGGGFGIYFSQINVILWNLMWILGARLFPPGTSVFSAVTIPLTYFFISNGFFFHTIWGESNHLTKVSEFSSQYFSEILKIDRFQPSVAYKSA